MKHRYLLARQWVNQMGDYLREATRKPFDFSTKTGHQDIVTVHDKEVERFFRANIRQNFPEDYIVGEELSGEIKSGNGIRWYIDPIDGTTNFVNLRKNFAISLGCYCDNRPRFAFVLDVINKDLFSAYAGEGAYKNDVRLENSKAPTQLDKLILSTPNVQDTFWRNYPSQEAMLKLADEVRAVRSTGSVALELCSVAEGCVDIFVAMRSAPWDHNAARLILQEAGCQITELGKEILCLDREVSVLSCRSGEVMQLLKHKYQL